MKKAFLELLDVAKPLQKVAVFSPKDASARGYCVLRTTVPPPKDSDSRPQISSLVRVLSQKDFILYKLLKILVLYEVLKDHIVCNLLLRISYQGISFVIPPLSRKA